MKKRTIVAILGIAALFSMGTVADDSVTLYTSGNVDASQYATISQKYLGLDNAEQVTISFDEELATISTTSASKLLDEDAKYLVYYNPDANLNVKAVNTGGLAASTIRAALQTAGIDEGEFLIVGLNDGTGLDCLADALYAYQKHGNELDQKKVQLAVEELRLASIIAEPDKVITAAKSADDLSGFGLDSTTQEALEVWAGSYADTYKEYVELGLETIKPDSLLVTSDDAYLGDYVDVTTTYEKPKEKSDSMFSCFTSKKKETAETEQTAIITPSTEKVEISSDMIPEDTERMTESETAASNDETADSETEATTKTETETEIKETTATTDSPIEVVEGGGRPYTVIPKDDSYKFDGLSEYEKSQDSASSNSSTEETVTVVGDSDNQYDASQYAADQNYKDDFAQNLLE